jgi:hypothetical protein
VPTDPPEQAPSIALPVVSLALRLVMPSVVVLWAVLAPVAANPGDVTDRRALLGVSQLALDSDLNGLAILAGLTFFAFALSLLAVFWLVWLSCDIVVACHRSRSVTPDRLPLGLVRTLLSCIQVTAVVGVLACALTYLDVVREPAFEPVWTALLLVAGGAYLVVAARAARRSLL